MKMIVKFKKQKHLIHNHNVVLQVSIPTFQMVKTNLVKENDISVIPLTHQVVFTVQEH